MARSRRWSARWPRRRPPSPRPWPGRCASAYAPPWPWPGPGWRFERQPGSSTAGRAIGERRFADPGPMRAVIAAARRALALRVEAKRQLRRLELRDLIGLALIAAGLVLLVFRPAR